MLGQVARSKTVICDEIDRVLTDDQPLKRLVVTVEFNEGGHPRLVDVERTTRHDLANNKRPR